MIPEIGHFSLILALLMASLAAIAPLYGASRNDQRLMSLAVPLMVGQFLFILIAFAALMQAYLVSDFSVLNVVANSHSLKPLLYKISGVWGNHEGSLVLWVLILSLFGSLVGLFGRALPLSFRARVLAIQALITSAFLLFMLITSNPFERVIPAAIEGRGLNPLLQDPGLAFHPPLLYLGYVGLSVAFSFAVAALIEGRLGPLWARWVRPWVLLAWMALTAGIALGSWWAYYELGWGGWWFWDPVENASFIPWLIATALLHSTIVMEKRDALKRWTLLLAILGFSMSLLGTFLVRSGVLTSVHAFAVDPERGLFILILLALAIGGSLALYAFRAGSLEAGGLFAPLSREGALVANNVLLSISAAIVLVGTLYPLFLDAVSGAKVTVGPPFFEISFVPLMVLLLIALGFGPLLAWKRGDIGRALGMLRLAGLAAFLGAGGAYLIWGPGPVMAFLGFALAFWLLGSILTDMGHKAKITQRPFAPMAALGRLRRVPRGIWGMWSAHMGMAVLVLGITASESWMTEKLVLLHPGDATEVADYTMIFQGVEPVGGPNYTAVRGHFTVMKGSHHVAELYPEQRAYSAPPMETTEAAIYPLIMGDLYAVVGDPDGKGGWSARLYWKPLISWIWMGVGLMVIGGGLSLSDRRLRVGAPKRAAITTRPGPQALPAE
ncbi:cytochrome c biogenesis protein CcmF [Iodidimonas nitroreducens]|uniref:Cytochrome c biogenesis protein CcmF n=1 Tax=Iodidimonas nitroreducens TaxID=1236968 RepID=A0A5A7N6V2_9PROT|nr:heme lyase CcmF/NrfE family subunit [Iodidimonas nitroreducens]GAK32475.1 cytochrome c-type biogenesis protein CycK [alpha proteobacterium Q-1]GER02756.1 cytochrome c biogenesis protein CcmF [Iodidimonas nitroreducens]